LRVCKRGKSSYTNRSWRRIEQGRASMSSPNKQNESGAREEREGEGRT
jgi:hypothetical protein